MLETYRAQVRWNLYASAEHTATNTFYFRGDDPLTTEVEDVGELLARLAAFWNEIRLLLPQAIFGTSQSPTVLVYRMSDATPRLPIYEDQPDNYTLGAGTAYPSDIAICLSYRGEYSSGQPRARKRGRLFIGPVIASTGAVATNEGIRVTTAARTDLLDGAEKLALEVLTSLKWVQWSETDQTWNTIVEASVDNQFDTRRSRDRLTSTRELRPITQ